MPLFRGVSKDRNSGTLKLERPGEMSGRSAGQPEGQTQRVRVNRACPCSHTDEKPFSGGSVVKNPASNAGDAGAIRSVVKNPASNAGDAGATPGLGRSPRGGNPTHSGVPALKIPWTEEPGGLKSTESQAAGHEQVTECTTVYTPSTDAQSPGS